MSVRRNGLVVEKKVSATQQNAFPSISEQAVKPPGKKIVCHGGNTETEPHLGTDWKDTLGSDECHTNRDPNLLWDGEAMQPLCVCAGGGLSEGLLGHDQAQLGAGAL